MPKIITSESLFGQDSVPAVASETDDEIKNRMRAKFDFMCKMTAACKRGEIRAMIVTGPPGLGKTFEIEQVLHRDDLFNTIRQMKPKFETVKGAISPVGLFMKLHEYKDKKNLVVFDDCDGIFLEEESLNILKSALDTSKRRFISYNKDSRLLKENHVPNTFEFCGGAIFITNITFGNIRSKKLRQHLEALESRSHFIDLKINTMREKILRIKQVVEDGMLSDLEDNVKEELMTFMVDNAMQMRELSLRTIIKMADLRRSFGDEWMSAAKISCMKT